VRRSRAAALLATIATDNYPRGRGRLPNQAEAQAAEVMRHTCVAEATGQGSQLSEHGLGLLLPILQRWYS
jgi:hypothetical protein